MAFSEEFINDFLAEGHSTMDAIYSLSDECFDGEDIPENVTNEIHFTSTVPTDLRKIEFVDCLHDERPLPELKTLADAWCHINPRIKGK